MNERGGLFSWTRKSLEYGFYGRMVIVLLAKRARRGKVANRDDYEDAPPIVRTLGISYI